MRILLVNPGKTLSMQRLWEGLLALPRLSKPFVPEVPWPADRASAGISSGRGAAARVLSRRGHRAGGASADLPEEPEDHVRPAVPHGRCCDSPALSRPEIPRCRTGDARRTSHLERPTGLPSARPLLDRRRRRHAERKELARREEQVPHSGSAAFQGHRDRVSSTTRKAGSIRNCFPAVDTPSGISPGTASSKPTAKTKTR